MNNICDCIKLQNELSNLILNQIEKKIYKEHFEFLLGELIKKILPINGENENDIQKLIKSLSNNILLLDTFLSSNEANFLYSMLKAIANQPILYFLSSAIINLIFINNIIDDLINLISQYIKLANEYNVKSKKTNKGKLEKLNKELQLIKFNLEKIRINIPNVNDKLNYIQNNLNKIEEIYNRLCKNEIKGDDFSHYLIVLELEALQIQIMGLYTIFIKLFENLQNLIQNYYNDEFIKNKEFYKSKIFDSIIKQIIKLLIWDDNLIVMCSKLNAYINIVKSLPKRKNNELPLSIPKNDLRSLLIKISKISNMRKDYFNLNENLMHKNLKMKNTRSLKYEIASLKRIKAYANSILNSDIFNKIPFFNDFLENYKNFINLMPFNQFVNDLLSGKIDELLKKENPFLSFGNIEKLLECANIKFNIKNLNIINEYNNMLSNLYEFVADTSSALLKIKDAILSPLKIKFNFNIDKFLNLLFEKMEKIKRLEKLRTINQICLK